MSDNNLAGTYNRYITYSSSDTPDYYTDLVNRVNKILNWQSDIDNRFEALYDMVSKFSEAEIDNTINTKVTNAINELINDLNGELDRKLEKPNIKAGTNISLIKDDNTNDIIINDTINLYSYATETYVQEQIDNIPLKKFNSKIGINALGTANDIIDFEEQKNMINTFQEYKFQEFPYCINLKSVNGVFKISNDDVLLTQTIEYIKNNNINVPCLHIYFDDDFDNNFDDIVTTDFSTMLADGVQLVINKFKSIDYKYVIVWNEMTGSLYRDDVINAVLNSFSIVRNAGKLAGIAIQDIIEPMHINPILFEQSDFLAVNYYQPICAKRESVTVQDGIEAWENSQFKNWLNYINTTYPDLEVIISETGILSYWDALLYPASWEFDSALKDETGKIMEVYYSGLFNYLKDTNVSSIWFWYPHDIIKFPDIFKKLINEYIGGGDL